MKSGNSAALPRPAAVAALLAELVGRWAAAVLAAVAVPQTAHMFAAQKVLQFFAAASGLLL